jgi:hypothetical protein
MPFHRAISEYGGEQPVKGDIQRRQFLIPADQHFNFASAFRAMEARLRRTTLSAEQIAAGQGAERAMVHGIRLQAACGRNE